MVGRSQPALTTEVSRERIQRCDGCERFDGDIEAAERYAERFGGRVHAIGDGENMAEQSDVWVMPGEAAGPVVWHSVDEARRLEWYDDGERRCDECGESFNVEEIGENGGLCAGCNP